MTLRSQPQQKPFFTDNGVTLYAGDAIETLATMATASVHCVVTSPPYWGLRDYGTGRWAGGDPSCRHAAGRAEHPSQCRRCGAVREDRQYGLEPSPAEYLGRMRAVFNELRRVLAADGTLWLNLGDTYSTGTVSEAGLPAKNLVGLPWRVALALQADGWILRNAIVWHKPNAMPESVRDRLSTRYELLFLLVRQPRYYFNLDAIRQPLAHPNALGRGIVFGGTNKGRHPALAPRARRRGHNTYGKYAAAAPFAGRPHGTALRPGRRHDSQHPAGKNPGDVWSISTRPLRAAHFAAFPVDLPLRCIAAGCPPDGVVLDPFSGAATTGLAARQLGRSYIGIDLNADFHLIALQRLNLTKHMAPQSNDGTDDRNGV